MTNFWTEVLDTIVENVDSQPDRLKNKGVEDKTRFLAATILAARCCQIFRTQPLEKNRWLRKKETYTILQVILF